MIRQWLRPLIRRQVLADVRTPDPLFAFTKSGVLWDAKIEATKGYVYRYFPRLKIALYRRDGDIRSRLASKLSENTGRVRAQAGRQSAALKEELDKTINGFVSGSSFDMLRELERVSRRKLIEHLRATLEKSMLSIVKERMLPIVDAFSVVDPGTTDISVSDSALPEGTRFFLKNPQGDQLFVIEQHPQVRTITFRKQRYRLAFPYVVFLISYSQVHRGLREVMVFFRKGPLKGSSDTLYLPCLPNTNGGNPSVCFPAPKFRNSISETVSAALEAFWGSPFNGDLSGNLIESQRRVRAVCTFDAWERSSVADPSFVLRADWVPYRNSLKSLCNGHMQRYDTDNPRDRVAQALRRVAEQSAVGLAEELLTKLPAWTPEHAMKDRLHMQLKPLFDSFQERAWLMANAAITEFGDEATLDTIIRESLAEMFAQIGVDDAAVAATQENGERAATSART